ncbi:MAG: hypothetical protein ACREEM_42660 [Blastocatellia bacterium]
MKTSKGMSVLVNRIHSFAFIPLLCYSIYDSTEIPTARFIDNAFARNAFDFRRILFSHTRRANSQYVRNVRLAAIAP